MEDPIVEAKKELINWIREMDDLDKIQELLNLKNSENQNAKVAETQAEYAINDDFDERFAKGISHQEMKRRTIEHIRSLPWKH
jgi:L-lysine 2,3-aminomutase